MEEVTRIWSPYGVDVHAMDPGGAGRDGAVRLPVVFEDRPDGRAAATVLGSVRFLDGVPEPAIVMYPNAIERIVSTSLMCSRDDCGWAPAFRQFILGRVLGRALAHEIGHILLRSRHHSATGLMRSEHALSHLVDPDRRRFALSSDEAARLTSVIGGD